MVLPFANLSNDPEQDFFADGLTEDLTTDLSHLAGSFVIARNTAFTYKGKAVDVKQLGRDLGVRYALEGSVRRTGDHVVLNAQLISPRDGRAHLGPTGSMVSGADWGEIQAEFVARLARSLDIQLSQAEGLRILREGCAQSDSRRPEYARLGGHEQAANARQYAGGARQVRAELEESTTTIPKPRSASREP